MTHFKRYFLIIIITALILLNLIPTPYFLVIPGQAVNLSENITVENGEKDAKGQFLLTSTAIIKANLLLYIYGFFDPNIDLINRDDEMLLNLDQKDYINIMEKLMQESQMISKVVALRKAGYSPEISGRGILINGILDSSPAKNKLLPGDVIIKIDEQPVHTLEEFSEIIRSCNLNQMVRITFLRDNSTYSISVPLIDLPSIDDKTERIGVGVYADTKDLQCRFPLKIEINLEKIKGPSAGLMIALEILNQLTENDLSSSLLIAGTGNLSMDGRITEVDGIKQKIISAKKHKADVFMLPQKNYPEALKFSHGIRIIPVDDFDDAIMKLIKL
ncbi:MAG: PDZ domain-containing protein [Candidatus Caldatribacteriota bacterium]|nr:PDZ domain-containing protein [Candidatus Caldatribacteriota bacterium]